MGLKVILKVVLVLFLGYSALCKAPKKGEVVDLDDDYFELKAKKYRLGLILFYAPWCGHCQAVKPHFESAALKLKDEKPPTVFARVDCVDRGKITCARFGIRNFPVLKIVKDSDFYADYRGSRDVRGIMKAMTELSRASPRQIRSRENLNAFRDYFESVIVGFFTSDSTLSEAFIQIQSEMKIHRFGISQNENLSQKFNIKDGIAILRPLHYISDYEDFIVYNGDLKNVTEIKNWIAENLNSLVEVRSYMNIFELKNSFVVYYCDFDPDIFDEKLKNCRNQIIKEALKFKSLQFTISPMEIYKEEFETFGLEKGAKDALAVKYGNMKYSSNVSNLNDFLTKIIKDEVKPFIRSQKVEDDESAVRNLSGEDFGEIFTNGKDTMVLLYAHWCGHCQKLIPVWKMLGERMADEEVSVVQIDASVNDVMTPYDVRGFPTIYWAGKDTKNNPEVYDGRHNLKEMIKFVAARSAVELRKYDRNGERRKKNEHAHNVKPISKDEL